MSRSRQIVADICIFSMLGALMFCTKLIMQVLPNIHLVGMLTIVYTVVYRWRALIPIYLFVLLDGLFNGFTVWWVPYLYVWALLCAATMLVPRGISDKAGAVVYPLLCMLHGLLFGALYAPVWALMNGLDLEGAVAWIIAGIPFDIIHMLGNLAAGLLVIPMKNVLLKLAKRAKNA